MAKHVIRKNKTIEELATEERIKRMAESGVRAEVIARKLGIQVVTVCRILGVSLDEIDLDLAKDYPATHRRLSELKQQDDKFYSNPYGRKTYGEPNEHDGIVFGRSPKTKEIIPDLTPTRTGGGTRRDIVDRYADANDVGEGLPPLADKQVPAKGRGAGEHSQSKPRKKRSKSTKSTKSSKKPGRSAQRSS